MSNLISHAEAEFRAAGWTDENGEFKDDMQKAICADVLALLSLFSGQGHSGSSAPYALNLFDKLAKFEPLVPLTGGDWEWNEVGPGVHQNKRCSRVFKQTDRFDGQAYDIEGIVFWEWYTPADGSEPFKTYFTSSGSCTPVTFPYVPTTVYQESK